MSEPMTFIITRASNKGRVPVQEAIPIICDQPYYPGGEDPVTHYYVKIASLDELIALMVREGNLVLTKDTMYTGIKPSRRVHALNPDEQKILDESPGIIVYDGYID